MADPSEFDTVLSILASLSISDWINIIASVVALAITIIITAVQIRHSNRMNVLQRRLEEIRRENDVKDQVTAYISIGYRRSRF